MYTYVPKSGYYYGHASRSWRSVPITRGENAASQQEPMHTLRAMYLGSSRAIKGVFDPSSSAGEGAYQR